MEPYKVDQFGGLNLRDDPTEIGPAGAIDLLNVDLDRRGRLRTRNGYDGLSTGSSFTNDITGLFVHDSELVALSHNGAGALEIQGLGASGTWATLDDAATGGSSAVFSSGAISAGSANATYLFIPTWDTSGNRNLQQSDGSNMTSLGMQPGFVAVAGGGGAIRADGTNLAPRLVLGHFTTAAGDPTADNVGTRSSVYFSNPGAPTSFTDGNFVHLRPGDGEEITGMVGWNGNVYVFKQSAVFIFTHETLDTTGAPVFNYAELSLPVGVSTAVGTNRRYVVAGLEGVYFSTVSGIYRLTSGPPVLVSEAISEVFGVDSEFSTLRFDGNPPVLSYADGRLFATYVLDSGGATRTLVYDPARNYWTVWSNVGTTGYFVTFPPVAFSASPNTADFQERILFPLVDEVFYTDPDLTTDDGSNISWSYQSGWYDPSGRDLETYTRRTTLKGYGSPTVAVLTDHGTSDANAGSVTLGTSPAVDEGFHSRSYRGVLFSHKLSGTSPALVSSLTHWVRSVRPSGLRGG